MPRFSPNQSIRLQSDAEIHRAHYANCEQGSWGRGVDSRPLGSRHRSRPDLLAGGWVPDSQGFIRRQRQRARGVDHAHSTAVPAAAIERRAFARRRFCGIAAAANPPELHLTIDAIGNATEEILNSACPRVGIEFVQRSDSTKCSIGCAQPFNRFFLVADHFHCAREYPRETDRPIRFGGRQPGFLAQTTSHGAPRNSQLAREARIAHREFLGQRDH